MLEGSKKKDLINFGVSAFEILLMVKNFAYIAKTVEEKQLVRNMAYDLYFSNSSLISFFVPPLIEQLQILILRRRSSATRTTYAVFCFLTMC